MPLLCLCLCLDSGSYGSSSGCLSVSLSTCAGFPDPSGNQPRCPPDTVRTLSSTSDFAPDCFQTLSSIVQF
ncbi:hypothetical protein C8F01DRAFT_1148784 [Mycena amicta]|nr:hypothetical protein C8F01DRAFT_1148784 [Mycena amicta]